MRVRYTSGTNREGRKRAQVRVHARWTAAVRAALRDWIALDRSLGREWTDLVGDRTDYDILAALSERGSSSVEEPGAEPDDEL